MDGEFMKKFVSGLLCGLVLSVSTVAFAANTIQAILFPSDITFQINGTQTKLDANENSVLNYDNKTYIPLRAFAEAMGAKVEYFEPSEATDHLHNIKISTNEYTLKHYEAVNQACSPLSLGLRPPYEYHQNQQLSIETTNQFDFTFTNTTTDQLQVEATDLAFEVYTASGMPEEQLVYRYKLPPISGSIPASSGYQLTIPWSQVGLDGKKIQPGRYIIKLAAPEHIAYHVEGSNETKLSPRDQNMRCGYLEYIVDYQ